MVSNPPHKLQGKFFDIKLELALTQEVGDLSLQVSRAIINRHLGRCLSPKSLNSNKLEAISKLLGYRIKYLHLDFDKILLVSNNISQKIKFIEGDELSINGPEKDRAVSNKHELFEYYFKFHPRIIDSLEEDIFSLKLFTKLLSEFDLSLEKDEILVVSGETVWSRYLNSFVLSNLFFNNKGAYSYILFDFYGIWESLIFDNNKSLNSINRKYLLPQILIKNYKIDSSRKIEINNGLDYKKLLIHEDHNLFDLFDGRYYMGEMMVPDWLFINCYKAGNSNKKIIRIRKDLGNHYPLDIELEPQSLHTIEHAKLSFNKADSQICIKKVGDWIDVNETIGRYDLEHSVTYTVINNSKLNIFHGQLIKNGAVLMKDRWGKVVKSSTGGKVDLSDLEQGLVRIVVESMPKEIRSPVSGQLVGFSKQEGFKIESSHILTVRISYFQGRNVLGKLLETPHPYEVVFCKDFKEFSKIVNIENWQNSMYLQKNLNGIVIKRVKWSEFKLIQKLNFPNFNVGIIIVEDGPEQTKMLNKFLGKEVILSESGLIFGMENLDENCINESQSLKAEDSILGRSVGAISVDGDLIYGKILKKSFQNSLCYYVDNTSEIVECEINNIILY